MRIFSSSLQNGHWNLMLGKHGTQLQDGVPTRSPHVAWSDLPAGTVSLALIMQDYDAIPVVGFSWIHWVVANIDPTKMFLEENASRDDTTLLQGKNSLASVQLCGEQPNEITNFYSGPRPPDAAHEYELRVYALDVLLPLDTGFRMNTLRRMMRGHVLAQDVLYGWYPSEIS